MSHGEPSVQCELSIRTSAELHAFIEQHKVDRMACEERYSRDRLEAQEFRKLILEKLDRVSECILEIAPSVRIGKKIAWGIVATVAVSLLTALPVFVWKMIKFAVRYM